VKTNKRFMRSAMLIAVLAALGASRVALADNEVEPNDPVANAQQLTIGSDGTVTVNGEILNTATHRDVDFYSFQATAGDVITVDIDGGMAADMTGVWTDLAIFGPDSNGPLSLLRQSQYGVPIDPGSATYYDARIDNFVVPTTGTYVVGVSSDPGTFVDVNTLSSGTILNDSPAYDVDGFYTLIISGVTPPVVAAPPPPPPPPVATPPVVTPPPPPPVATPPVVTPPPVQEISIEIRPGRRDVLWAYSPEHDFGRGSDSDRDRDFEAFRHHQFRGGMPVALLSSDTFNALDVDQSSLKFGETGNESSLIRCERHGVDVNRDKQPDLVCFFDFSKADFKPGDTQGKVTGTTKSGQAFEGEGWLKIMTGRRHRRDHD